MRTKSHTRALAIGLLLSAWLLSACTRRATQLMLVIDSDLSEMDYNCVGIEVARLDGSMPVTPTQWVSMQVPANARVPFSLGVLPPHGDASLRVEIRVEAHMRCQDPNTTTDLEAPIVRSVMRAGFAPEQTLRLPMFLAARCTGMACGAGLACNPANGMCEPIMEQNPSDLMPVHPGDEFMDASAGDASRDAGLDRGVCPLEGRDFTSLASTSPRTFGLTIALPSYDWVLLYDDAGSLHALRFAYDQGFERPASAWNVSPGADAIALEGLSNGNALLALVNPTGSTELVRYAGSIDAAPAMTSVGTGRLVQRGRHTTRFGARMAAVVERDAGVAVVAIGSSDALQDVFVSPTSTEIALGNTPSGQLLVAIGGGTCEMRTYDASGNMVTTQTVTPNGTGCAPRGVQQLDDGRYALLYATTTGTIPRIRISMGAAPADEVSMRLSMDDTYASPIGAVLGNDSTFRVTWVDHYDYPSPPDPGPLEPGVFLWTNFNMSGEPTSEYSDHGDATTDHELTRWERLGDRTALVMSNSTGFLFRSICRPTYIE